MRGIAIAHHFIVCRSPPVIDFIPLTGCFTGFFYKQFGYLITKVAFSL